MSSLGDPRRARAASLIEPERTSDELDARPSGRVPRDLERGERTSEAEFVPRASMRVARSAARSQTARVAQLHTPEGAALESEFFWEGDQPAPERAADAAEWDDVDSAALALRNREAVAQIERRQKYQQRVLYGVTAAACFTAFGLTIELLRQKGRDVDVASAARALTETPTVEANRFVAPVVAPPINAVVNAPLTPQMPVETVAEPTVNNAIDEATTAAAPAKVSTPSAPVNALAAAAAAAPKGLAAAQPVAVSPKIAIPPQAARLSITQARPPAAALAGASFAPIQGREGPASITREVRPSTPSEKPPTAAFPAVKN